jgi:hypothetical protein
VLRTLTAHTVVRGGVGGKRLVYEGIRRGRTEPGWKHIEISMQFGDSVLMIADELPADELVVTASATAANSTLDLEPAARD